jgi:hypothetical protein
MKKTAGKKKRLSEILDWHHKHWCAYCEGDLLGGSNPTDQAIKEIQELLVEPYCDLGNAGCEFHSCKGCAHHKVGKLSTPRLTAKDIYQIVAFDFMDDFMRFERGELSRKKLAQNISEALVGKVPRLMEE